MSFAKCAATLFLSCLLTSQALFGAPQITNVSPNAGATAGGNSVVISGSGFTGASQVNFGTQSASFVVNNDSTITVASVPGQVPGVVDITVTAGTTSALTPDDQYTYQGDWFAYISQQSDPSQVFPLNLTTTITGTPIIVNEINSFNAITPNRQFAYAPSYENNTTVSVLNLFSNTVSTTIGGLGAFPANQPLGVAVSPDGSLVYVTDARADTVVPIPTSTNTPGTPIPVGSAPFDVIFTPNGAFAYVADLLAPDVEVIDTSTGLVTATIPLPGTANPAHLAITPTGNFVYVLDINNPAVYVIDTSSNILTTTIDTSGSGGMFGNALTITGDGKFAYVDTATADISSNVDVIDLSTNTIITTITGVGTNNILGSAAAPDSQTVYFSDNSTGDVIPIDVATNTVGVPIVIPSGAGIYGMAITPDESPAANFTTTTLGSTVSFDASQSQTPFGTIATYVWNFGDGSPLVTTILPTTSHTYATAGTYSVTLTVTNSAGTSTTQSFTGHVVSNNGSLRARITKSVTANAPVPPPTPTSILPPRKFHGTIVKKRHNGHISLTLKTHWKQSLSPNVVSYEIYRHSKRIATLQSFYLRFHKTLHPVQFFKRHLPGYKKFLDRRYKIRAVSTSGITSPFVRLKITKVVKP